MLHPGASMTFETSELHLSPGKRCLFGPVGKKMQDFGIHCLQHTDPQQLGITELPPQGSRFCLITHPASKKQGSAKWTHRHKHTEESELKPRHKENKNSWDQRAAWGKEME